MYAHTKLIRTRKPGWKLDRPGNRKGVTQGISRDEGSSFRSRCRGRLFASLKENGQNAIVAYSRTIPPIRHKIPDPEKLNIFSYLWGKFKMLILKEQIPSPAYPMKEAEDQQKPYRKVLPVIRKILLCVLIV